MKSIRYPSYESAYENTRVIKKLPSDMKSMTDILEQDYQNRIYNKNIILSYNISNGFPAPNLMECHPASAFNIK